MVQQVLQRFGFTYSSPQSTPLPTGHSLSSPPSDESVEPSGLYLELVGCLMYLMTCTRPDLAYPLTLLAHYVAPGRHQKVHWDVAKRVLRYLCCTSCMGLMLGGRARVVLTGHADASWVDDLATQRSSRGYTFSLGSGSVSWRSTHSSSVLSSSCGAEICAGAMAPQELRWLTYLLTDLGEAPCSLPVLYVDNKAMIALCQEHRLEHRTKHIALLYFLARELQQRGQLRLAYMVSRANTADVFTKALQPCDHQRFCTVLGLAPLVLPHFAYGVVSNLSAMVCLGCSGVVHIGAVWAGGCRPAGLRVAGRAVAWRRAAGLRGQQGAGPQGCEQQGGARVQRTARGLQGAASGLQRAARRAAKGRRAGCKRQRGGLQGGQQPGGSRVGQRAARGLQMAARGLQRAARRAAEGGARAAKGGAAVSRAARQVGQGCRAARLAD
ncbi:unnamed protein product [Closterium sp. NIES-54]